MLNRELRVVTFLTSAQNRKLAKNESKFDFQLKIKSFLGSSDLAPDHGLRTPIAHWASYVVRGITHLKVRFVLDFAKSQIAEKN